MASKDDYKYKVYNALRKRLKVDGIEGEGAVAKILLETFLERSGVLKASHVYGKKTKKGEKLAGDDVGISFKQWRKKLEDLGWIEYDEAWATRTKRFSDHKPGYKLLEYINTEKARISELATTDDLRRVQEEKADRSEVEELKAKIEALELRLSAQEAALLVMKKYLHIQARSVLGADAGAEAVSKFIAGVLKKVSDELEEESTLLKEPIAH